MSSITLPRERIRQVPRYNYAAQLDGELRGLMRDIRGMLLDGRYVLTREVEDFEQAFAAYLGVPHARGVGSGTDALVIALQALGIGPRDEVVTHANTFHATVAAIVLVGATPVLVDAVEETFLMDVEQASAAVTTRTRVLVPVHLCGKPTPMEPVLALAERHGLRVMEDAAQAHGARWNGRRVGTFGIAGCFSFHPSKNLAAAGDGGAIVTHDAGLDAEIACRRALGQRQQNDHVRVGMNSKLDALQARILSAKLARLDRWSDERRRAARWYHQRLAGLPVRPQAWDADEEHVFHLFQVSTDRRDALLEHLRGNGVDAVVRYPVPIHLQPAFADQGWRAGQFPVAERLSRETLCLPIRPDLAEDEVDYVAECIRGFFGGAGA